MAAAIVAVKKTSDINNKVGDDHGAPARNNVEVEKSMSLEGVDLGSATRNF